MSAFLNSVREKWNVKRIWIAVADSISYDNKRYAKRTWQMKSKDGTKE